MQPISINPGGYGYNPNQNFMNPPVYGGCYQQNYNPYYNGYYQQPNMGYNPYYNNQYFILPWKEELMLPTQRRQRNRSSV